MRALAGAPRLDRRRFGAVALVSGANAAAGTWASVAASEPGVASPSLVAVRPAGFRPLTLPGRVVQAEAKGDFSSMMQKNQLWPLSEVAERLLERAMMDLTGAPNLQAAMARFVHPDDVVAVKVNGIAGQVGHTMAVNFELILALVEAILACGVPPERVTVYEQYPTYLMGTRVGVRSWQLPAGVKTATHNNRNHPMQPVRIYRGIPTRFCRYLTEATAVINMTMMKDHSICGFTGALKNITHGNIDNPHEHHANQASPQIAMLYNHPIVTSRVRLHVVDAFKITYDKGPLDKDPRTRVPHGSVYVSTDPVALDTVGWRVIDEERKKRGLPDLTKSGREPRYVRYAGDLGLGQHDWNEIRLTHSTV